MTSFAFRFYWLVNLNSTVVFLGIAYIQQSVAKSLGFLIPFTSVLLALIAIHMMCNKLTYKPKKGNQQEAIWYVLNHIKAEFTCVFLMMGFRWIITDHTWSFL